jgi:hypothetical protein
MTYLPPFVAHGALGMTDEEISTLKTIDALS